MARHINTHRFSCGCLRQTKKHSGATIMHVRCGTEDCVFPEPEKHMKTSPIPTGYAPAFPMPNAVTPGYIVPFDRTATV